METYGLSNAEYLIMEFLWERAEPVMLQEIVTYCNEEKNHPWKQQTVYTFLSRMHQKGVITAEKRGQKRYYAPAMTLDELKAELAEKFINETFKGSFRKFLAALTGRHKLSADDRKALQEALKS